MIVPNQVAGLHYNATPARELAIVPDCTLCALRPPGSAYAYCQCNALVWTRADAAKVRGYSATCYFLGKSLLSQMGSVGGMVPLGLVRSSWGGTRIDQWQTPKAIATCPQNGTRPGSSQLFNGMINPFVGLQLSAVVWYQVRTGLLLVCIWSHPLLELFAAAGT